MRQPIEKELGKRILVLDGAMGTMVQRLGLAEEDFRGERFAGHTHSLKGLNDILCLTHPEIIADIHRQYLLAGADIIETDTFNANAISLAEYSLENLAEEINREGARIARCVAGDSHYVAGSMGPTGVSLSISTGHNVTFDMMAEAYRTQARGLIKGGVDLLLLETVFDSLNAKAALYGIELAFSDNGGKRVPLMISATLTENGRLLSGPTIGSFAAAVGHARPLILGLNCGFGPEEMMRYLPQLRSVAERFVSVHPNAGLPDETGRYTLTPPEMGRYAGEILRQGLADIVGGCCGTTPEHIAAIASAAGKRNREGLSDFYGLSDEKPETGLALSGLEPLRGEGFLKVGERCNVAGSRKFLRLVREGKLDEATDIAASQIENGAAIIDINMDDPMLDAPLQMEAFLERLGSDPRTSGVPVMIDSSDFSVIRTALRKIQGRPIVNSISLKEGEEAFLAHAREIHACGAAVIVMAFDEEGQASTFERRISICRRAYDLLTLKGAFRPEEIVFDPNVLTVGTGIREHDNYALDFLNAVEWISHNLPGTGISGGISNLSFAFRGNNALREAIHTIFLSHAITRGLTMAIVNPATSLDISTVRPELREAIDDLLFNRHEDAAMRLLETVGTDDKDNNGSRPGAPRTDSAETGLPSLEKLLMRGSEEGIEDAVAAALDARGGNAIRVVNESLIATMDTIGTLFGEGRMFLPHVVRSAGVMKKAVEILAPQIEEQGKETVSRSDSGRETESASDSGSLKRPKFVIATVRGDVHDIGKNIVAIVLRCSGFDVTDLGVMVPGEEIVEHALEENADFIGLSGLISPSLQEMASVASLMERRGLRIPLFIGGAATSPLHTAVMLAPLYSGPVVHTADAATLPKIARRLAGAADRETAMREIEEEQQQLCDEYASRSEEVSPEEARRRGVRTDRPMEAPAATGIFTYRLTASELRPLINRRAFLGEWKTDPDGKSPEAMRLLGDAGKILDRMGDRAAVTARVAVVRARALPGEDAIEIIPPEGGPQVILPTPRCLVPNPATGVCPALCDFVYSGDGDHIALFAVTVPTPPGKADDYESILLHTVAHRLAEAATEWLHRKVSTEIWHLPGRSGIRPAVGYPSLPDQSLIFRLDSILHLGETGITLTSNGAMVPPASTSGLILPYPGARYFSAVSHR